MQNAESLGETLTDLNVERVLESFYPGHTSWDAISNLQMHLFICTVLQHFPILLDLDLSGPNALLWVFFRRAWASRLSLASLIREDRWIRHGQLLCLNHWLSGLIGFFNLGGICWVFIFFGGAITERLDRGVRDRVWVIGCCLQDDAVWKKRFQLSSLPGLRLRLIFNEFGKIYSIIMIFEPFVDSLVRSVLVEMAGAILPIYM